MDEKTFGSTPAAMYLVRALNKIDNKSLTRAVSRRLTNTAKKVNELLKAFEYGLISVSTLADTLRLMRLEISDNQEILPDNFDVADIWDTALVDKLRRNVQIGHIKYAIRLATLGRKVEQAMQVPEKRAYLHARHTFDDGDLDTYTVLHDQCQIFAGSIFTTTEGDKMIHSVHRPNRTNFLDSVTPELLHERSLKRQGKPHTL